MVVGDTIGPYRVLAKIGEGGMGEVYRATDTKLKREVAVKVLPSHVAADPERLARFQREAEVLASLNHPNIAAIYGLEEADQTKALVMELVEGPTLADRIAQGAIPVDEALPIAKQIAEALEAAHEQGIIHRDLKPANVKLRPDGVVKVLDFGLAKALEPTGAKSPGMSQAPTITTPAMTQAGMILGTAAYMSPEQAKGRTVDKRSDVWAFGAVLYEMLTGRRAFDAEDVSETLAAVLRAEVDWARLPNDLSPVLGTYIRRCLQKDPKQRIRDIGDVRLALEGAFETAAAPAGEAPIARAVTPPLWRRALPAVVTAVVAGLIVGFAVRAVTPPDLRPVIRSIHELPEGDVFEGTGRQVLAISADGEHFVYNSFDGLSLRRLDALEDRVIPGTEGQGALNPAFSPDGQSVVYYEGVEGQLNRISVTGGASVMLTAATIPFGMSWGENGTILYGQPDGIWQVSENGGEPQRLIATDAGEQAHGPQRLPGGDWVLFTLARTEGGPTRWDEAEIVVASLASGEQRVLLNGGSDARYVATGHLVYAHENVLYAVLFDVDRLEVTGGPVPVVQGVARTFAPENFAGAAFYALTTAGTLIYVPGEGAGANGGQILAVADRNGQGAPLPVPSGIYDAPRVSPDSRWVAYGVTYSDGNDIAVYEIGNNAAPRRLTFGGSSRFPVWSADGERVVFQSGRDGDRGLFWQLADGAGSAERLTTADEGDAHVPDSVSSDGEWLSFTVDTGTESAVWALALASGEAEPLIVEPAARVAQSVFSPDGRWLAYQSTETGEDEIFVQPFPPTGAKYQLPNVLDNHHPLWSPDGRELFYVPGPSTLPQWF